MVPGFNGLRPCYLIRKCSETTQSSLALRKEKSALYHFVSNSMRSHSATKHFVRPWGRFAASVALRPSHHIVQISALRHFSWTSPVHHSIPYQPPKTGFISYLPKSWTPYAELIRLDKPTGTYYLFFPCLFSTLMAATYSASPPFAVLSTALQFFTGALIMRGAGCTINDLWDRNLDPYVQRTRHRPIARGAVSPFKALAFTGVQLAAGLSVLLQFHSSCLFYGIPSLLLVATYPLAKRVTDYPQFVLGLTFSWGAIMGFPALGVDILADPAAMKAVAALYTSCVSWTILYDMIYAHMDIKDDAKVGIKSIALRHEKETKLVLSVLGAVQVGLLVAAGSAIGAGPYFFLGSCGSAAATLGLIIWRVKLKDASSCWWWFKYGALFTGGGITSGLLADYLVRLKQPLMALSEPEEQQYLNT